MIQEIKYPIQFEPNPDFQDVKHLSQQISQLAHARKQMPAREYFSFFIREDEQILGGVYGFTIYGACYTDLIWVHDDLLDRGYGKLLLDAAEKLGKERGCTMSILCTMDWQAKDWYERQGYQVEFERNGYINDSTCYHMIKIFT